MVKENLDWTKARLRGIATEALSLCERLMQDSRTHADIKAAKAFLACRADPAADALVEASEPVPSPAAEGWRPIAMAPKDGTPILVWDPTMRASDTYMPEGALQPGENSYQWNDPRLKKFDDARYAIGYWRPWAIEGTTEHPWGNRNHSWPAPTHWQPLPAPPKEPTDG